MEHPCHGALLVDHELRLKVIQVSLGGVRGVSQRHGLLTMHVRPLRLQKATWERKLELAEEQIRLLERFSPEFRHGYPCVRGGPGAVHARGTTLAPETCPVARPTAVADDVRNVLPRLASRQWL